MIYGIYIVDLMRFLDNIEKEKRNIQTIHVTGNTDSYNVWQHYTNYQFKIVTQF